MFIFFNLVGRYLP